MSINKEVTKTSISKLSNEVHLNKSLQIKHSPSFCWHPPALFPPFCRPVPASWPPPSGPSPAPGGFSVICQKEAFWHVADAAGWFHFFPLWLCEQTLFTNYSRFWLLDHTFLHKFLHLHSFFCCCFCLLRFSSVYLFCVGCMRFTLLKKWHISIHGKFALKVCGDGLGNVFYILLPLQILLMANALLKKLRNLWAALRHN